MCEVTSDPTVNVQGVCVCVKSPVIPLSLYRLCVCEVTIDPTVTVQAVCVCEVTSDPNAMAPALPRLTVSARPPCFPHSLKHSSRAKDWEYKTG